MEIHDLELLQTRLTIARRNMYLVGSIFLISFLAFFMVGMLRSFGDREILLVSTILVAFGFSLIIALIRYEVAKALTDFAGRLIRDNKAV
jgi:Na+-driven multidrug efflux pump